MIRICYTYDFENYVDLCDAGNIYDEYRVHSAQYEKFIYLANLFKVVKESAQEYLDYRMDSEFVDSQFWKKIKLQQDYVNAVMCYKDYLRKYDSKGKGKCGPVSQVQEDFFQSHKWLYFVQAYRNMINHEAYFAKDYAPISGEAFINIDEIIKNQEYLKQSNKKNDFAFFKNVKKKIGSPIISMSDVVKYSFDEISEMNEAALHELFDKYLLSSINWYFDHIYKDNNTGKYADTIFYEGDNELGEINYPLEMIMRTSAVLLGPHSIAYGYIHNSFSVHVYDGYISRSLRKYK